MFSTTVACKNVLLLVKDFAKVWRFVNHCPLVIRLQGMKTQISRLLSATSSLNQFMKITRRTTSLLVQHLMICDSHFQLIHTDAQFSIEGVCRQFIEAYLSDR